MAALAYAVTASLRDAPQKDIKALLRERVLSPLGVPDDQWSIGYGRAYPLDGLNLYANWGGGAFTSRASARLGEWMMHLGRWDGKALVKETSVQQMLKYAGMPLPAREKGRVRAGFGPLLVYQFRQRVAHGSARRLRRSRRPAPGHARSAEPGIGDRAQWRQPLRQG